MPTAPKIVRAFVAASVAAAALALASCELYQTDRCFVDEQVYEIAYGLFMESGSLDIVERRLTFYEWQRCEINEVIYRLEKEFEVPAP